MTDAKGGQADGQGVHAGSAGRHAHSREKAMLGAFGKFNVGLAFAVLVLSAGFGSIPAAAEQPTAAQILNALKPKPLTRSLSNPAAARKAVDQDEERFLDSVRAKPARLLSAEERARVATIALERPSIDLEINFDYNSASISRKAIAAVAELGKALSSPELKGSVVLLAGHTDGKGADEYRRVQVVNMEPSKEARRN